MFAIYLIYGLAFFCLGLAVALESRRASALPLGQQLPWLAAFGLVHALVEWSDMLLLTNPMPPYESLLLTARTLFLPLSAILLIRFGAGMIGEAGPLPRVAWLIPLFLFVPAALLIAYALVAATTDPFVAIDVWSRYLLYGTGCVLAGLGFLRQRRTLSASGLAHARNLMLGAALVFFFNAFVAGLIVPPSPYGLARWLNHDTIMTITGVPVQVWRMLSAVAVTIFVIRALDVFESERRERLSHLEKERLRAQKTLQASEKRFRTVFEMAPVGMSIVNAEGRTIQANQSWQQIVGYSQSELQAMHFNDFTHEEDRQESQRQAKAMIAGKQDHFRMEKRYLHKEGDVVWAQTAVSIVRDDNGAPQYFITLVEDVTERRRIAERLQRERIRAERAKLKNQTTAREVAEKWTDSLVETGRRIARMESIDDILMHIAGEAVRLLALDLVSIGLLNEDLKLGIRCQGTKRGVRIVEPAHIIENDILQEILRSGRPSRFPQDVNAPGATWYCPTVTEIVKTAAVIPLQVDDNVVGGLWVARFTDLFFSKLQLRDLGYLANQVIIALQQATMAAQLQSVAIVEERSRIAREMHDGLSQILGYLGLQLQTIQLLIDQGNLVQAMAELQKTQDNVRLAHADVRENILSLRTTLSGSAGLIPALQEYLCEFGIQTGIEAQLFDETGGMVELSPLAEVQLVRILQEALTNVRKHAQAGQVHVRLRRDNGFLLVQVYDDGQGFVIPAVERQAHFGLDTMRERAEAVGGRLKIESAPRQGTELSLWIPQPGQEGVYEQEAPAFRPDR
jgi:PAS domain S-box-containing protein